MPIKTALYLFALVGGAIGGIVYHPLVAVYAYLASYTINPAHAWWGAFAPSWAYRYSLILGASAIIGSLVHRSSIEERYAFHSQEILLVLFCVIVWISHLIGVGQSLDSNALKVTKYTIMLIVSSRLVTNQKRYDGMILIFILTGLYLGYEAFRAPGWMFIHGRLNRGIGGSDFSETNFLAAHFAFLLPFIGVSFLRANWKMRAFYVLAGAFVFNGVILCRSRGVFLALLFGGVSALFFAKKEIRKRILAVLILGCLGGAFLVDPGFWTRATEIHTDVGSMDASAAGRIEAWKAAFAMTMDHPFGVGEGNFKRIVGRYNHAIEGKDTHNTLLRCMAELGVQGLLVLLLMMANSLRILSRIRKNVRIAGSSEDAILRVYGLEVALVTFFVAGLFITHTYIEEFYWLLMMPVFLKRSLERQGADHVVAVKTGKNEPRIG